MDKGRPILLLLGVPPPFGGGEIRAAAMADYFRNNAEFRICAYSRARGSKRTQGRFTADNLWFGAKYIATGLWRMMRERPAVMYLALPKNLGAFLRAIPLIWLGSTMDIRTCGELAGARFLFLDRPGIGRRLGLSALRRLSSIRFLGQSIARAHEAYGLSNPVVFSNGIACPNTPGAVDARAHSRPLQLLYVGALARSKGVEALVRAVAICRTSGCPVQLTLVGEWSEGRLRDEILDFVGRESLQPHIRFTGRVTGDLKWDYYRQAAVLVHPTAWDGQPLTILEAMAMGLGIIATGVGAIPDTMRDGENGILLADAEPVTIAGAIQALAKSPGRLEAIMRSNRARYESEYTQEAYLHRVEEWLENVRRMQ